MPYVGHNVYGARSTDYSATGGREIPRKLTDCWCEPCWWTQFAPEVKPDHRGFDAVRNPLRIGDVVTIGWRDSNRPKETGHVRNLASRVTIDTATHHGLVADYRDVLAVGRA